MKGGDDGAVIVEGKPDESSLIKVLAAGADPHMPPKKQLSAANIGLLKEWLRADAPWDAAALSGQPSPPRAVPLAPMPATYKPIMAIALSPDGSRLAVGCRNEVVSPFVRAMFSVGAMCSFPAKGLEEIAFTST